MPASRSTGRLEPVRRLGKLEANGIVDKARDTTDARKFIYRLTEKGIGLLPMLVEMVLWASAHEKTDAPAEILSFMRADREGFMKQIRADWVSAQPKRRLPKK